jgi:hypothetical protein
LKQQARSSHSKAVQSVDREDGDSSGRANARPERLAGWRHDTEEAIDAEDCPTDWLGNNQQA